MKLQVRIIEPNRCSPNATKEIEIMDFLSDLEDYQVKHITEHNGVYTVFYCKDSSKTESDKLFEKRKTLLQYNTRRDKLNNNDVFEETKRVQHKEGSCYPLDFTKTTDLFRSPYTGPLNLSEFAREQLKDKRITSVHVDGKPVNWGIDDKGRIIISSIKPKTEYEEWLDKQDDLD